MVLSFEVNSIYFIPVHGVSEAAVPVEISAAFKPPSRLALLSPLRSSKLGTGSSSVGSIRTARVLPYLTRKVAGIR